MRKLVNRRIILISLSLLAIGLAAVALYVKSAQIDNKPSTESQTEPDPSGDEASFQAAQEQPTNPSNSGSGNQASSPAKQNVTVSISQAEFDSANQVVRVRALATSQQEGTCKLELTKTGQTTLTYTGQTEAQTSYASCPPFNIPRQDFPVGGPWTAKVTFESAHAKGEASQEINL